MSATQKKNNIVRRHKGVLSGRSIQLASAGNRGSKKAKRRRNHVSSVSSSDEELRRNSDISGVSLIQHLAAGVAIIRGNTVSPPKLAENTRRVYYSSVKIVSQSLSGTKANVAAFDRFNRGLRAVHFHEHCAGKTGFNKSFSSVAGANVVYKRSTYEKAALLKVF